MTEAEWLACQKADLLLVSLGSPPPLRACLRVLAACCRRIKHLALGPAFDQALRIIEQFASGSVSQARAWEECNAAAQQGQPPTDSPYHFFVGTAITYWLFLLQPIKPHMRHDFNESLVTAVLRNLLEIMVDPVASSLVSDAIFRREMGCGTQSWPEFVQAHGGIVDIHQFFAASNVASAEMHALFHAPQETIQANIVRDIFGNPFRTVVLSPDWRTDTAMSIARQMYESHDFSAMPILADALQDAGCDNADILDHCRGPGPHVRACWVVDAILGKN